MVEDLLTRDAIAYIVERVLNNAKQAIEESKREPSEFLDGMKFAYYEILDTIKNELEIREEDLKYYGLDFQLETIC